jgi:hypothetical protein
LRTPGFKIVDFGDVHTRTKLLGKWMTGFPRNMIIDEAKRLLPMIIIETIKVVKLTNTSRKKLTQGTRASRR